MHNFVKIQSEIAVRNLCAQFPYDNLEEDDENELTLRSGREEVNKVLEKELQQRFAYAGIKVVDAKISHLCYTKQVAEMMLKKQQAKAVVSARKQIVNGAVGVIEMAIEKLEERRIVNFTDDHRARTANNLLVVLTGEHAQHRVYMKEDKVDRAKALLNQYL
jgi:regulator of protease activity HflC (stomatin/prohibitin superfamily)